MKGIPNSTSFLLLLFLGQQHRDAKAFTIRTNKVRYQISLRQFASLKASAYDQRSPRALNTLLKSSPSSSRIPSSRRDRWTSMVSTPDEPRPKWARDWMPTWLVTLRPTAQLAAVLLLYIFHLTVLTQRSISFPFQLIPNERGHFQSIGLDS